MAKHPLAGWSYERVQQRIVDTTREVIDLLYHNHEVNVEFEYSSKVLAQDVGTTADGIAFTIGTAEDRVEELIALGVLSRRIQYGKHVDGVWSFGRVGMWTLLVPYEEATRRLDDWAKRFLAGEVLTVSASNDKRQRRTRQETKAAPVQTQMELAAANIGVMSVGELLNAKPAVDKVARAAQTQVALAQNENEEVRAVAGPDAPTPFAALAPQRKASDAEALVEAARQYAARGNTIQKLVDDLQATANKLGIAVDTTAVTAGIHLDHDERLEDISLVLPVIDRQASDIARLIAQNTEMRTRTKRAEELEIENRKLKGRVERLISERVATQQHVS